MGHFVEQAMGDDVVVSDHDAAGRDGGVGDGLSGLAVGALLAVDDGERNVGLFRNTGDRCAPLGFRPGQVGTAHVENGCGPARLELFQDGSKEGGPRRKQDPWDLLDVPIDEDAADLTIQSAKSRLC